MIHAMLTVLGWSIFILAVLAGLALNLLGLFGNWLILAATLLAWIATRFEHFSPMGLFIMFLLACAGEIIEAAAAAYGASRFGGSRGAAVAACVGGIAGAVLGTPIAPVLGTLVGACAGAFVAAALYEYIQLEKTADHALSTGLGAALGRVAGLLGKFTVGIAMLIVAAVTF